MNLLHTQVRAWHLYGSAINPNCQKRSCKIGKSRSCFKSAFFAVIQILVDEVIIVKTGEYRHYVEAIKLAAGSVQYKNLSVTDTLQCAISQLYEYYCCTQRKNYLHVALLHIQAYLEMGFDYENKSDIFDKILNCLDTSKEEAFPQKYYTSKIVKINKSQIKSMIRRWPASGKQKYRLDEVVEDIIYKVKSKDKGIFHYKCEVTKDIYELVINETEIFFHDLVRGIFYTFEI